MQHPIELLNDWLAKEQTQGSNYAQHAILATVDSHGAARSRVVAIRDINQQRLVLFTQKGTQKVADIQSNPMVSLTFWFALQAREVVIEGEAKFLSQSENEQYWAQMAKTAQIRFCAYAPTSGQAIENKEILENKRTQLEKDFQGKAVPVSPAYCGIAIKPKRFVYYSYRLDELSDVCQATIAGDAFHWQTLSP